MNVNFFKASSLHTLCFAIPVYTTLFLTFADHRSLSVLLWVVPLWSLVLVDLLSPPDKQCVDNSVHPRTLDYLLLALAVLQIFNIYLLLRTAASLQWTTIDSVLISMAMLFAVKVIVGTSSSFSCIVLAHELIHRPQRHFSLIGRLLLTLVCYEHFFTEHLRGHHRHVGTVDDPATARFGESYSRFWRRTVPAQFKSAWRLEKNRVGSQASRWSRLIRNRVLQGIAFECLLLFAIFLLFGLNGVLLFSVQAFAAVRKLEAINYLEHWGLSRSAHSIAECDSWDSDSWFTLHAMVGLSRHADHHLHTHKPFFQLKLSEHSPKLPYGYFAMIFLIVCFNDRFQALAKTELKRRQLGPYASTA